MNRANRPRLSRISGSSVASKLLGRAGDGSTLTLDFTTGQLDPRLTFTRASTGTFINASGNVATALNNVARFDYDPDTRAPRGLLIEATATNLINWSETFDTTGGLTNWNWSALNVTRGTVTTTNPAGASATVIKVEETTTNGLHAPLIVPTGLTALATYTFSVWAKAVERTFVQLWENGGSGANSMVNLSTGAIVSESTAGITNVTAFGTTGWYRISMRLTLASGQTSANCQLRLSTNGTTTSYAGTTGSGIYIWGAQLEASLLSSYIPTVGGPATRNVDTAIIAAGSNFTSWYQGATQGTFYAEWFGGVKPGASGSTNRTVLSTDDVSTKHLHMVQTAAAGNLRVADFGGTNNVTTSNTLTSGARTKGAFSYNGSTANVCLNGGTVATGSSLAFSATPTWLVIGGTSTNGTSISDANVLLNNSIRTIKYWPSVLPNSTLQALTA